MRRRSWLMMENWARVAGFAGIIFAVLVCVFIWAISYPPLPGIWVEGQHYDCYPSAKRKDGQESIPASGVVSPLIQPNGSHEDESKTCRDERERLQKAANERGVTVATWLLSFATIWLAVATTGLWIFTAFMWNSTRQVVRDGQQSLKIALRTASAAERHAGVAESDQRAWVSIERVLIVPVPAEHKQDGVKLCIRVVVRNLGRTPARGTWLTVSIDGDNGWQKPTFDKKRFIETAKGSPSQIGIIIFPMSTHTITFMFPSGVDSNESSIFDKEGKDGISFNIRVAVVYYVNGQPNAKITHENYMVFGINMKDLMGTKTYDMTSHRFMDGEVE